MTAHRQPIQLAVLISGGGRSLMNLHDRIASGTLDAAIRIVVSSRGEAPGAARARDVGLPIVVVERKTLSPEAFQQRIAQAVRGADLVCMAGFLSLWRVPDELHGRVINIHPALLPDFGGPGMYGRRVHQAVLRAGRSESGCTVHFCDNEYDRGPIILQRKVPVQPDDTPESLAARVFEQECIALPEVIQLFAEGRIRLQGRAVTILP
ncbi:MAG: phosphoribosylglycinamide formyltransferase [Phycisphaerales bacterium]|nr:phosphoribosylglycinamide formyltransferase [Phycisphaerales bacterium]